MLLPTVEIAVEQLNKIVGADGNPTRADLVFMTYELQGSNLHKSLGHLIPT